MPNPSLLLISFALIAFIAYNTLQGNFSESNPFNYKETSNEKPNGPVWQVKNGALMATLQLNSRFGDQGQLILPSDTEKIFIEIGANSRNTFDQEEMHKPENAKASFLTFEPLLDKYATLLARGSSADRRAVLGMHHPRGFLFPFAVGPGDKDHAFFNIANIDGCSSLLEMKKPEYGGTANSEFSTDCATSVEKRMVPVIPLKTVLDIWLGGRVVEHMKVDAQGFDVQVIESAGTSLQKSVKSFGIEVVNDDCDTMYVGAYKCTQVLAKMQELGFTGPSSCKEIGWEGANGCEAEQVIFKNNQQI